jgi:hypothetical protein
MAQAKMAWLFEREPLAILMPRSNAGFEISSCSMLEYWILKD